MGSNPMPSAPGRPGPVPGRAYHRRVSSTVGPEMTPARRATAVRAFRTLTGEDRREVLALARKGRRHPDERVVAVAWWYAAAVLQPRWWNRMPLVVLPVLALALLAVALLSDAWPVALLGLLVLLAGAGLGWQRITTQPVLRLMRAPDGAGTPADSPADAATDTPAGA